MKKNIILSLIFSFSLCGSALQTVHGSSYLPTEEQAKHQAAFHFIEQYKAWDECESIHAGLALKSRSHKPSGAILHRATMSSFSATPIDERYDGEERALKKIIPGEDGRIRIMSTGDWPASVHGVVRVRFPSSRPNVYEWGTGIVIGPRVVLTAAHNLYDRKMREEVESVTFLPGMNERALPFGESGVIDWHFPEKYIEDGTEDYAILVLDTAIGMTTGYFGVGALADGFSESELIENLQINITGYPQDKVIDENEHYEMWGMQGPINGVDEDFITYEIDTYRGQSGSGICCQLGDDYYVLGVHVQWDRDLGVNKATPLTKSRIDRIEDWVKDSLRVRLKDLVFEEVCYLRYNITSRKGALLTDYGVSELSEYKLPNLVGLDLDNQCVKRIQVFAGAFTNLRFLNLRCNRVEVETLHRFTNLIQLDLSANALCDSKIESFPTLPKLRNLNLEYNNIGIRGLRTICRSCPSLMVLSLSERSSVEEEVVEVEEIEDLDLHTNLTALNLQRNELIPTQAIGHAFPNLTCLDLSFTKLDDAGLEHLSPLTKLKVLELFENNISVKGAQFIARAFTILNRLVISKNKIGEAGVEALLSFAGLHILEFYDVGISSNSEIRRLRDLLRASNPNLKITVC